LGHEVQDGRGASEGERPLARGQAVDARRGTVDVRYRFRHVLYRDHLDERLGSHRRVELHGAVARALSATGASPSRLAFHFERGRDFSRAVALWTQAGDDADRAFAKLEALECYRRAAALPDELPAGERALRRLVLEHGRGWANHGLSRASAARQHFLEFARLARELETAPEAERQLAMTLASEYFERPWSDVVMRRPAGIFPKAAASDVGSELLAEALHCCCHAADTEGRADDLHSHARARRCGAGVAVAAEARRGAGDRRDCSWRMGPLWSARCELSATAGDAATLQQTARRWLRSARVRADAEGMKRACRWLALGLARAGDVQHAVEQLAPGLDAAGALPVPLVDWRCQAALRQLALLAGDAALAARARDLAQTSIDAIARGLDDAVDRCCFEQMALGELDAQLAPAEPQSGADGAGSARTAVTGAGASRDECHR
jgi:hypothetical protein